MTFALIRNSTGILYLQTNESGRGPLRLYDDAHLQEYKSKHLVTSGLSSHLSKVCMVEERCEGAVEIGEAILSARKGRGPTLDLNS
jgi:hypothetical protein